MNYRDQYEEESLDWKPTKTPNKRAEAVTRKHNFLKALFNSTRDGWCRIPLGRLGRSFRINSSPAYLLANGIIEKKRFQYRWRGPAPTRTLAEAWCNYQMTYTRIRRDRTTSIQPDVASTLAAIGTADKRADRISSVLDWCYRRLHRSYRRISLSSEFTQRGIPHEAIRFLRDRGCLDRPRNGVYKWIGLPPDRELALWLYGMLSEHHRAIYRFKLTSKSKHALLIDDLIGRSSMKAVEQPLDVPKKSENASEPASSSYWSNPYSTW